MTIFLFTYPFVHVIYRSRLRFYNGFLYFAYDRRMTIQETNCTDMIVSQRSDVAVYETGGRALLTPRI